MTKMRLALILALFFVNTIYCENEKGGNETLGLDINNTTIADNNTDVTTLQSTSVPTSPTTEKPTIKPTTPPTNTNTTTPPTTTTPAVTTVTPTPPPPANTTTQPTTTTTVKPAPPVPVSSTTVAPAPHKDRHFDGASFIGGIILAVGLMGIGFIAFKFYKARTERNYHTL